MRTCGIDPGVSATGIVLYDSDLDRFLQAKTLRTAPTDGSFDSLIVRARSLSLDILNIVEDIAELDVIAIESFVDITPKRGAKLRYYTPILLGMMDCVLKAEHRTLIYQDPRAKTPWNDYRDLWAQGMTGVVAGDDLLTNDHLRDAAVHCLVASAR